MKKIKQILTVALLFCASFAFADDIKGITISVDSNSSYKPTTIVNGDFDECPWQGFEYGGQTYTTAYLKANAGDILKTCSGTVTRKLWNGVGEGWNTTEVNLFPYGKVYDWTKKVNGNFVPYAVQATYTSSFEKDTDFSFIEMNGFVQNVFYQDLATTGGDVIRWTLNHAYRGNSSDAGAVEQINVQIGAPETDSNGALVPATTDLDPKIKTAGKAKFNYNGVDNSTGTYGFGKTNELANLSLTTVAGWQDARGVYIIPDGQNVTRFAFISELPSGSANGNLLDSITFSTLIGNLNAYAEWDSTVVVTGYWGETDSEKQLYVEFFNETGTKLDTELLTMSSVSGKNFKIVIPESAIKGAKTVKIYHQDYESAAKTITIERHYHGSELFGVWNYSDKLPATGRYALASDVVLSSDVTLTGNSEMAELGGAKICLNGHTISGANIKVASGENQLTITSLSTYDDGNLGTIKGQLEVTGGDFTLNGGNVATLKVNGDTCKVTGLVNVDSLTVTNGNVLTIDSELDKGSGIYLSKTPDTCVITSGFGAAGLDLGQVINFPSGITDYMLIKTKSGELKVKQHKSAW